ncbi:diiron oxygenase [Agrobacterium vitis]|uniref:diiron oxygenase n=1 Tax=Agrobacterium vitis TaxID=373 RepID=UPI0015742277|nr:diiron oxygenase [Agrobacterium vitis]NSZ19943.1 diiron oxygenase [Agrobacterium vitis]QZO07346.1 diiron oxygenase [Agrobacterium vitis]UJL90840.1 diiron oxygenase [Agrobacterium vitis]
MAVDRLFCDEDLLTTYGTEYHDRLSDQQKFELSKWEAVNFFSLNVHGIKGVLEFASNRIYEEKYKDITQFLHIFIAEENAHMWFFARFCEKYAGKIYSTPSFKLAVDLTEDERDLYMFASTLIFEEFVDFYNHKVGSNKKVADIVRQINHQHHVDESRHVSFGREVVRSLFQSTIRSDGSPKTRRRIETTIQSMIGYFVSLMYNPRCYEDARVYQACGFDSPIAMRNALRTGETRRPMHDAWFRRTADFFVRSDIISNSDFVAKL